MENITKRKLDELGRVVLPREVRDKLGVQARDVVDISFRDNAIIIEKSKIVPQCAVCGTPEKLTEFSCTSKKRFICADCKKAITES